MNIIIIWIEEVNKTICIIHPLCCRPGRAPLNKTKWNKYIYYLTRSITLYKHLFYYLYFITLSSTDRTNLTNTSKPWSHMSFFDYVPKHPWISLLIYSGCILALGGCRSLYHQPPLRPCQRRNTILLLHRPEMG